MNKNEIFKTGFLLVLIIALIFVCYFNKKLSYENYDKQKQLDEICFLLLNEVVIGYNYDYMNEAEIHEAQAKDINNLKAASTIIQYTSWPQKEKLYDVDILLYQYLNAIYTEGKDFDESTRRIIIDYYCGILANIGNEYCEQDIDRLLNFLQE